MAADETAPVHRLIARDERVVRAVPKRDNRVGTQELSYQLPIHTQLRMVYEHEITTFVELHLHHLETGFFIRIFLIINNFLSSQVVSLAKSPTYERLLPNQEATDHDTVVNVIIRLVAIGLAGITRAI
ncbi:hypothetical protein A8B98_00380 [Hymenobacter sp. UV11]|nr:hypothetical protein A8B98_00380 [Hymenobacter sp. UV11]